MNVIEATDKRNPTKVSDSAADLFALTLEEALPNELLDDIERQEQRCDEFNSINRVQNLNIRHGPSGSPKTDEMVGFEYPDFHIMNYVDPSLNAVLAKSAVYCDISQSHLHLNRLELMRSDVHHSNEQMVELSRKHLNYPTTLQAKQKPISVDQVLTPMEVITRMQLMNAEGGVVITNNLLRLSENHCLSNTPKLENMHRTPEDIEPVDDEGSTDIWHHRLEEAPPDLGRKFQKNTSNKSGEGVLQAGKKVRSKFGNGHASNVKNSNSYRKDTLKIGARTYSCEECNRQFKRNSSLIIHARTHSGEKPYECEVCGNSFAQIGSLRNHLRIHTGEKPYNCEICAKSFAQSAALSNHLRIHTGEQPYNCEICAKSFTQSVALSNHLRIHTGEKPYECSICGQSFIRSSILRIHLRLHAGEMPYNCEICAKSFTHNTSLREHLQTHTTGENTHMCEVCYRCFSRKSSLTRHLIIHTRTSASKLISQYHESPN